jgi:phosphatidylglycerol:prolipoprotein diacylglycerol transferase
VNPIAFQIGPIAVHWYGILIVTGILAAAYLSTYTAKLWGEDPQLVWDALVWCVFLGVVGARLYHVLTVTPSMGVDRWYYFRNPLKIFATWEGGLGIYGAVAGGALGLYIVIKRAGRNIWTWTDITTPGLILAQAIGRWGNFVNQELYGRPTNLPWGIYIDPLHRLPGYEMYERFHPTFFYESVWNLTTCLVLVYLTWRYRDRLVPGVITCLYFISYSMIRFLLEFIRLDSPTIGNVPIAQIVAACVIVVFVGVLVWRLRTYEGRPAAEAEAGVETAGGAEGKAVEVEETATTEETATVEETPEQATSDAEAETDSTT